MTDALGVSFDTHIGHDFIEDAESRFEFYHTVESRIPFDLEYFNKITQGGLPKKTLNKMAKVYHKQNFNQEVAEHEEFESLYEEITQAKWFILYLTLFQKKIKII